MSRNNKKGFTLIELLAVIVILAIIALITVPLILNVIETAKKGSFKDTAYGLIESAELYYSKQQLAGNNLTSKTFIFPNASELGYKGESPKSGTLKINKRGQVALAISNDKYCIRKSFSKAEIVIEEEFETCELLDGKEALLHGADPELKDGMIAVTLENNGTVLKADLEKPWYSYENKKWANAVLVTEESRLKYEAADAETKIAEEDILAYFVWVPRYRYKLWAFTASLTTKDTTDGREVEIIFENKDTKKADGTLEGEWLTHPAFTFGEEELNGIWVGKFETGYVDATTQDEARQNNILPEKLVIKPNKYSWRAISMNNAFYTVRGMVATDNIFGLSFDSDSHLIKNMEWGAVAYLSKSIYGNESYVHQNTNNNGMTGCGYYFENHAEGFGTCNDRFGTSESYSQSTNGNITGIFDMSGGLAEMVMGYATNAKTKYGDSGFTDATFPEEKYVDLYTSGTSFTNYAAGKLGDATKELGPFYKYYHSFYEQYYYYNYWNDDDAYFIYNESPWFHRGGSWGYRNTARAGIFNFKNGMASAFRVIVA